MTVSQESMFVVVNLLCKGTIAVIGQFCAEVVTLKAEVPFSVYKMLLKSCDEDITQILFEF